MLLQNEMIFYIKMVSLKGVKGASENVRLKCNNFLGHRYHHHHYGDNMYIKIIETNHKNVMCFSTWKITLFLKKYALSTAILCVKP